VEEIKLCFAIHLALDQLWSLYLTLGLPITPGQRQSSKHRVTILFQASPKAAQFGHSVLRYRFHPGIECLGETVVKRQKACPKLYARRTAGLTSSIRSKVVLFLDNNVSGSLRNNQTARNALTKVWASYVLVLAGWCLLVRSLALSCASGLPNDEAVTETPRKALCGFCSGGGMSLNKDTLPTKTPVPLISRRTTDFGGGIAYHVPYRHQVVSGVSSVSAQTTK
jgi:hypothetical protein